MDDATLDDYMRSVVAELKLEEYTNEDVKSAVDKLVIDYKNARLFLALYYIYSLILGIITVSLIMLVSVFLLDYKFYVFTSMLLVVLAYLLYFGFKYFDFKKEKMIFITLSTSILVSVYCAIAHYMINKRMDLTLSVDFAKVGGPSIVTGFSHMPVSIVGIIILIVLTYNIIPVVNWLKSLRNQMKSS